MHIKGQELYSYCPRNIFYAKNADLSQKYFPNKAWLNAAGPALINYLKGKGN